MNNVFSVSLMKKYGWKEGDGLGKSNQGISKPIRANLKFNNLGIGYQEVADNTDSKWANVYSSALSRLSVDNGNDIKISKDATEDKLNRLGYTSLSRGFKKSDIFIQDGLEVTVPKLETKTKKSKKRNVAECEAFNADEKCKKKINKNTDSKKEADIIEKGTDVGADEEEKKSKKKRKLDKSEVIEVCDDNKSTDKKRRKKSVTLKEETTAVDDNADVSVDSKENKSKKKRKMDKSVETHTTLDHISEEISERKMRKKEKKLKKLESLKDIKHETSEEVNELTVETSRKKKKSNLELVNTDNLILPNSSFMTCHPSARFGLGMSGKLARAQKLYEAEKLAIQMKENNSLKAI